MARCTVALAVVFAMLAVVDGVLVRVTA